MKVVILTGGSSGIGLATAKCLAAQGCRVYEFSRRDAEFDFMQHMRVDVADAQQVRAAVDEVCAREGRIDVLINNAGFGISGAFEFTEEADARRLMDVNLFGMNNTIRAVLPHMRRAGSGRIVNLSSVAGPLPIPFQAWYSISKAAVNALTRAFYLMDEATSVGLCYWGAIEYWGESDGWPKKGWDYSFFRRTLDPHPQAWLVRSAFRDVTVEPVVKIGVETGARVRKHWNDVEVGSLRLASAWDDAGPAERRILVFSNAEEVELRLNGRSLGRKRNEMNDPARRNVFDWPSVGYVPGRLEAVAWSGEKVVARDAVVTVGPAVAIAVACENPDDWVADGQDLEYVRVEAVDVAGRRVRGALGRVTFAVDGAARFLAADDGDSNTARRFDDPAVDLHAGAALCIFRSTKTAGAVAITVDAGPLGTQTIRLMTKPRMIDR